MQASLQLAEKVGRREIYPSVSPPSVFFPLVDQVNYVRIYCTEFSVRFTHSLFGSCCYLLLKVIKLLFLGPSHSSYCIGLHRWSIDRKGRNIIFTTCIEKMEGLTWIR